MPHRGAQDETIAFLADPATHGGAEVVRVETHGNLIFLAGEHAWKIKRAVHFPYMDFSTLQRRHAACKSELETNRRFAPDLYLGLVAITREAGGGLALGGSGTPVEWAVHMRRFAQQDLLSAHADAGTITDTLAKAVADCVHDSHAAAQPVHDDDGHRRLQRVLSPLIETLSQSHPNPGLVAQWARRAREALDSHRDLLDRRARSGWVRRCHGDLHAANIVLWRNRPVLYDAIEFDPELAAVDTLYDLSFLLMDLVVRGAGRAANIIFNRTLARDRGDEAIATIAVLPLLMSMRAAIRAMVVAERATQEDAHRSESLAKAAQLLDYAHALLQPPAPRLVAVAGLSGTGKSTLAASLAPQLGGAAGAVHIRTDLVRKALARVGETQRLPATAYTEEASRAVYARTLQLAQIALAAGAPVVVDAVAAHAEERTAIAAVAAHAGVPFHGLWLTGPLDVLSARVAQRRGDASDATIDVVRAQAAWDVGTLGPGWRDIDAAGTPDQTFRRALDKLGLPATPHRTSTARPST